MAEAAVAAVAEYLYVQGATFASAWAAAEVVVTVAAVAATNYIGQEQQRKQQRAAVAQYNASLKDRYIMVRSATEPRAVVLGRQRVSGPVAYIGSYGADRQHLVFDVLLAAHEIDAIEAIYFDDEQVTLDGADNVVAVNRRDQFTLSAAGDTFTLTSEPAAGTVVAVVDYGSTRVTLGASVAGSAVTVSGGTVGQTGTVTISYRPAATPWIAASGVDEAATITLDASGNGSVTLPAVPVGGSVFVVYTDGLVDSSSTDLTAYAAVAGAVVTVTGSPRASLVADVRWRRDTSTSRARVRKYLGAPGQAADAGMVAALPGIWTSAHTMAGLAHLVVECDYDPDAFPGGIPNVSAVVRGAKLHDPRTGVAAWSENPALMCRYVALSPLLGRQSSAAVNDAAVIVAANVCDTATAYVVQGQTYTRALYTAGAVVKSGTRAKDALDDLTRAMAGRWLFTGGQLTIKAGAYVTPLQSLDETWLSGAGAVQVQPRPARSDVFNVITGRFADEQRDYKEIDYPRVESSAYIAEDGAELPQDLPLNAVGFVGQAQQVAAVTMRDARQGLRVTLTCNMRAWPVQVFDTLNVTLPRFGWAGKVFEVLATGWTLDGGIQLTLKETDPSIYAVGTSFSAADPAPNTLFPSPFKIQPVTALACTSGNAQMLRQADGTLTTRIRVDWATITDPLVLADGGVEVRYGPASLPESAWRSEFAPLGQARVYLGADVREGTIYMVKARAFNALVKGAWSLPVAHLAVGKTDPASAVTGLAGAVAAGQITWTWAPCPDLDYSHTEVRSADSNWGSTASPPLWRGAGSRYVETATAAAGVTRYARHVDTSGNPSATSASASTTVATADLIDARLAQALADAATAQATADGKIDSYWQATAPGVASEGDLWFDTDDSNRQYRWTSGAWVAAADTRIGAAVSAAAGAQATADGKVVTFVQASAPTAEGVGDLWLDSDEGHKLYRWNGSAWVALALDTGALAVGAATQVISDTQAAPTATRTRPGVGIFNIIAQLLATASYTNSSGADQTVEVSVDGGAVITSGTGSAWLGCAVGTTDIDGATVDSDHLSGTQALGTGTYVRRTRLTTLSLAAGATLYAQVYVVINPTTGTINVTGRDCSCRLTVIKR